MMDGPHKRLVYTAMSERLTAKCKMQNKDLRPIGDRYSYYCNIHHDVLQN